MAIINRMLRRLGEDVSDMQEGLQPEHLAAWYDAVIRRAIELAPEHLKDKIAVIQDPILPMRFNLDISKRAVKYFMMAVDENLGRMPYTTGLYFLKVEESLSEEMDRSLA